MDPDRDSSKPPGKLEGRYANYFAVGHSGCEFVIDCGQSYSENGPPQFYTRIVTGPAYAKALLKILQDSIKAYEMTYGSISDVDCGNSED
jgi:Protein of unknown function (DUF3467)